MENTNWKQQFRDILFHTPVKYLELEQFITDLLEQEKNKWLEALPKEKERCVSDLHKSQLLRDDYFKDLAWLELLPPNN